MWWVLNIIEINVVTKLRLLQTIDLQCDWKQINELKEELFNEYKEEFDIEALIEAGRISVEEIFERASDLNWVSLIVNHADTLHDLGLTGEHIIEIASKQGYDDRLDFLRTIQADIECFPHIYQNWKNDEILLVYLKLQV